MYIGTIYLHSSHLLHGAAQLHSRVHAQVSRGSCTRNVIVHHLLIFQLEAKLEAGLALVLFAATNI